MNFKIHTHTHTHRGVQNRLLRLSWTSIEHPLHRLLSNLAHLEEVRGHIHVLMRDEMEERSKQG